MLTITEKNMDGELVLELHTRHWLGEVVLSRGANLWRLRHASGAELLRTPPSMDVFRNGTEMWGIPVLFPPNRLVGGRFSFQGRDYHFPVNDRLQRHHIHGMVSRQPWVVESTEADALTLRFDHTAERESYVWFPHPFVLRLRYDFGDRHLTQSVNLCNTGEDAMPFGFGFHTAFRLPFGKNGIAEHCRVRVTAGDWQWEMSPEDDIPTGRILPLAAEEWNRGLATEQCPVFVHAPIEDRNGFRGAVLDSPAEGVRVVYEIDKSFKHWVLWNHNGGRGFFCPEPQTWAINAPNLPQPPEITGMQALDPKEVWSATNRIILERIEPAPQEAP